MSAKRDFWVVRDDQGMLHSAQLLREYDDGDKDLLLALQISTGCAPVPLRFTLPVPHHCTRPVDIPSVHLGRFSIVEWRVREEPTCLACITVSEVFK